MRVRTERVAVVQSRKLIFIEKSILAARIGVQMQRNLVRRI